MFVYFDTFNSVWIRVVPLYASLVRIHVHDDVHVCSPDRYMGIGLSASGVNLNRLPGDQLVCVWGGGEWGSVGGCHCVQRGEGDIVSLMHVHHSAARPQLGLRGVSCVYHHLLNINELPNKCTDNNIVPLLGCIS